MHLPGRRDKVSSRNFLSPTRAFHSVDYAVKRFASAFEPVIRINRLHAVFATALAAYLHLLFWLKQLLNDRRRSSLFAFLFTRACFERILRKNGACEIARFEFPRFSLTFIIADPSNKITNSLCSLFEIAYFYIRNLELPSFFHKYKRIKIIPAPQIESNRRHIIFFIQKGKVDLL